MFEEHDDHLEKLDLKIWKNLTKIILTDKKTIFLFLFFVIFMGLIDTVYPLLNKFAMDTFFVEKPDFSYYTIFVILYVIVVISMFVSVTGFIIEASKIEETITYSIRKQAFIKLQELSFSYFDVNSSGWIMARLTSDTKKLAQIISWGIVDTLWAVVVMVGTLIISFIVNYKLALVLVALIPLFIIIGFFYRKKILKKYRNVRKINSAVTAAFTESFAGANTSKTLVLEKNNLDDFTQVIGKHRRSSIQAALFSSFFWPSILIVGYIGVALVVIVGSKDVLSIEEMEQRLLAASSLYLFISFATRFFDPIMNISRVLADFQQAQAAAERVLGLIQTTPDIVDTLDVMKKYGEFGKPIEENYEDLVGNIEFKNVTFSYDGSSNNDMGKNIYFRS